MNQDDKIPYDGKIHIQEFAGKIAGTAQDRPAQILSLAERVNEAKHVFKESITGLTEYWSEFKPAAEKMIVDARQCRMTMVAELAIIKKEVKEIQNFVGSTGYNTSVSQIKELLDLAERFVKLSKDQALPVLLDAALKLQVKA